MKRADNRPSVAATEPRKVEIVRGEKSKKILDTQHSSFLPDPYRNPCNAERDRQLLGLLSQTAYAAILKTFQALFDRADVRPGCVVGYVLMKKTTHYWMGITKPTFPVWQARWVRDI